MCIYNKRWKRHEERERLYEEKEVIVSRAGRNLCRVHAGRLRIGGASGCNGDTQGGAQETDRTSGTVKLRVWAEESTYDALNKMIDSFKEEYKGQATFDITLEQNADSDTRDNVLGDVHNAADVFILADDQVASMVAGGALYPVPNADEVKKQMWRAQ